MSGRCSGATRATDTAAVSAVVAHHVSGHATTTPPHASTTLSSRAWRNRRILDAPSDSRTAISCCRLTICVTVRPAIFTQAMASSTA